MTNPAIRFVLALPILTVLGAAPAMAWQTTLAPAAGIDDFFNIAQSVAVDQDQNVVLGGRLVAPSGGSTPDLDIGAVKLSGVDGSQIWRTSFPSGGRGSGTAKLDPSGNVILAGYASTAPSHPWDMFAAKLDKTDGHALWTKRINGTADSYDSVEAFAVDANGDVAITGHLQNSNAPKSIFIVAKLSGATGDELWRRELTNGTPVNDSYNTDYGLAIRFDAQGDVIAAGQLDVAPLISQLNVFKLKGTTGETLWWQHEFANDRSAVKSLALDSAGDAIVVGGMGNAVYAAKVANDDGEILWSRSTSSSQQGGAFSVAIDPAGDAYVSGAFTYPNPKDPSFPLSRFAVLKLNGQTGDQVWAQEPSAIGNNGFALALVLDGDGNVLAAGGTGAKNNSDDVFLQILKLSPVTGAPIYRRILKQTQGTAIAVDAANAVIASTFHFFVAKFSPGVAGKSIALKDDGIKPEKRKLQVQVKDKAFLHDAPGGSGDPTVSGATLVVENPTTHEQTTMSLPAANWIGGGKPPGAKSYKYKLKGDPCSASIKDGAWQVTCSGTAITFTLDEPTQGALAATLTIGSEESCVMFGGTVKKDLPVNGKKAGVFQATNAPPPASCH